jgi:tRNA G18 (ribose-2'-O)-methylase SpoU
MKNSKYDQELLSTGDTRNVVDKYRCWTNEAIKADLGKSRFDLQVAIENLQHDFNAGTVVRNANAFNVKAVHIIGRRHYNRRGAMATDKYLDIKHHESVDEFVKAMRAQKYKIISIDIVPGAKNLDEIKLSKKCVLVFGNESEGISKELLASSDDIIQIKQFGSTRSVNVGVASGIAMYTWLQQHTKGL